MKKNILILASTFILVLGLAQVAEAATEVPEAGSPSACNHEDCSRWYELNLNSSPNACKYTRDCGRWHSVTAPEPVRLVLRGVNFDSGSANIKAESFGILDSNVAQLKRNPGTRITIVGHTDSQGGDEFNQNLSEARAQAILNYFTQRGVSASRMTAMGRGESQPVASNADANGRYQNRRIEIDIR